MTAPKQEYSNDFELQQIVAEHRDPDRVGIAILRTTAVVALPFAPPKGDRTRSANTYKDPMTAGTRKYR